MAGELAPITTELTIAAALRRQYQRVFHTLRDAMKHLDDAQWTAGDVDWLIPARMAYHAISATHFYSRPEPNRSYTNRLGGNWETSPATQLPSRARLLEYVDEVERAVSAWLAPLSDQELLTAETAFPWTGQSVLERAIYSLRHLQHHTAQINAELRRRGLPRGDWQ